jgi:hypothetical protein
MRSANRVFSMALIGAVVAWLPFPAAAAWNAEDGGPHREHRVDATPTGEMAKEPRSMAPKPGVAMERPVGPAPAEPPAGTRSLAPKSGVAFSRPVGPAGGASAPETGLASD